MRALYPWLVAIALAAAHPQAHAFCDRKYEETLRSNHEILERYGESVLQEDWFRKRKSLGNKLFRDSEVPGLGVVFDLITEPHDAYASQEVKEGEKVDEKIRLLAIDITTDERAVIDVLRDSFHQATENDAFQDLYQTIKKDVPNFPLTEEQVASIITAANYGEHFCLELARPAFLANRFGRPYETGLVTRTSLESIKKSIENGAWNKYLPGQPASINNVYQTAPEAPNLSIVYPRNPLNDRPDVPYYPY